MRSRSKPYRDVASVRTLQRAAAEAKAAEAGRRSAEGMAVHAARNTVRLKAEQHFLETHQARPFSLDHAGFAAASLMASEESLRMAAGEADKAMAALTTARRAWQHARVREEKATDEFRAQLRAEANARDETATQDVLDRRGFDGRDE